MASHVVDALTDILVCESPINPDISMRRLSKTGELTFGKQLFT